MPPVLSRPTARFEVRFDDSPSKRIWGAQRSDDARSRSTRGSGLRAKELTLRGSAAARPSMGREPSCRTASRRTSRRRTVDGAWCSSCCVIDRAESWCSPISRSESVIPAGRASRMCIGEPRTGCTQPAIKRRSADKRPWRAPLEYAVRGCAHRRPSFLKCAIPIDPEIIRSRFCDGLGCWMPVVKSGPPQRSGVGTADNPLRTAAAAASLLSGRGHDTRRGEIRGNATPGPLQAAASRDPPRHEARRSHPWRSARRRWLRVCRGGKKFTALHGLPSDS